MRQGRLLEVLLLGATLPLATASTLQGSTDTDASKSIDEVVVSGSSTKDLREAVVKAEERFYDRYNELNPDKQFDMHCYSEARTGALVKERVCRVEYYERALALESRSWMEHEAATPAYLEYLIRQPDFRKNLSKIVSAHPELFKLLQERNELQRRYEKQLKLRRNGRPAKTR